MSSLQQSPNPLGGAMERAGLLRSHSWPATGPTACGGKRYAHTVAEAVTRMRQSSEPLAALYRGAGVALLSMVRDAADVAVAAHVPALLDEAQCPLCDADAPLRSFLWDGSVPEQLPWENDVAEVVLPVLSQLHMKAQEVVLAVAILEELRQRHNALLQARSARPIFLAACVLARKLATDRDVSTRDCYDALGDCFTSLSPLLLARSEEQLLELLDWRFPNDRATYELYAHALMRSGLPPGVGPTVQLVPRLYF